MASNPVLKAKVKGTDRIVEVYKLKNPKDDKVWCNFSGCTECFSSSELEFI